MTSPDLMPIGSFAQRCGLTASALRFYGDAGLLRPAQVAPTTGYRFYGDDQLHRAVLLRRLREIGMSLAAVGKALDADPDEAIRLVDEHVDAVIDDAEAARRHALRIKDSLLTRSTEPVAALSGPVLAAAIGQVLTATTADPDIAVLGGVRFDAGPDGLTVTATDRYRLATRTMVPSSSRPTTWAATVDGTDLRNALADLRRSPRVEIDATENEMWLRLSDRGDRSCRLLAEPFPDHRAMLEALPPVTTRVQIPTTAFLRALEHRDADQIGLVVGRSTMTLRNLFSDNEARIPATVRGPSLDLWFEMITLYPAIISAIGADVLVDFRGHDLPATIRSADRGDLTTLVMPIAPPGAGPSPAADHTPPGGGRAAAQEPAPAREEIPT
ncbi:MerR family transcriptional regulator [Gordonia rubripertincta]|uniref:MerR family transcriptional regulator n=2 Tax=Gordonia rubripertincta TaxID=36822 RepID=A0AAW6R6P4_GORRU|nr:MerR family transcriptional regulator [Gordonia rubripertincta]MDG6779391.1 MerR family transcriptional regulator [Gordonia rubripertincta]NKY62700.1 MerR family transcriptional regulator [Gordonia rubripertincta]GAB85856.1 putative MerR family transcriptional regulator [Gordonia rubripertincta NBRC 101908]